MVITFLFIPPNSSFIIIYGARAELTSEAINPRSLTHYTDEQYQLIKYTGIIARPFLLPYHINIIIEETYFDLGDNWADLPVSFLRAVKAGQPCSPHLSIAFKQMTLQHNNI